MYTSVQTVHVCMSLPSSKFQPNGQGQGLFSSSRVYPNHQNVNCAANPIEMLESKSNQQFGHWCWLFANQGSRYGPMYR